MYQSIGELPTQVTNSLDSEDAKAWMDAYNAIDPKSDDEIASARRKAWEAVRNNPSSFAFDIVASVEAIDSDGEVITLDTIKSQMDEFISRGGNVQDVHGNYNIGVIYGWDDYTEPTTGKPGILVHGNVFGGSGKSPEYERARQEFVDGKNSLSIGGEASIEGTECGVDGCFVRRNLSELMEISLCTVPANPYAHMIWYNDKAVIKERKDESVLKVQSVDVHKSYESCDYERVRYLLSDCSDMMKSTRISKDGFRFATDMMDELKMMDIMDSRGIMFGYDTGTNEFVTRTYAGQIHKAFVHGLVNGLSNSDGGISDRIPIDELNVLKSLNMLKSVKGRLFLDASMAKEDGGFTSASEGAVSPMYGSNGAMMLTPSMMFAWRKSLGKG